MGKMINFAHVNAQADFTAILNHYGLEFTQQGGQIRLRCPFHDDTKPSLSVTLEDTDGAKANTFHCFGCGEGGNVFSFLMKHDQLGFPEAVEKLAAPHLAGRDRANLVVIEIAPVGGDRGDARMRHDEG